MLKDHKYFHFTPFPDKTNVLIFFKNMETLFRGHFWPHLVIFANRAFSKKKKKKFRCVTYISIWATNMQGFRKN